MTSAKKILWCVAWVCAVVLRAAEPDAEALEKEVAALAAGPQVTVIHFWAPWCPNCRAEMTPEGWTKFIEANPGVTFVFLNVWHRGQDPKRTLDAAGLGGQSNLVLRTHPNAVSRASPERMNAFLGLPVTWLPTTWVYRDGKLRTAFNYGEIRFPLLQQMVDDATGNWKH